MCDALGQGQPDHHGDRERDPGAARGHAGVPHGAYGLSAEQAPIKQPIATSSAVIASPVASEAPVE